MTKDEALKVALNVLRNRCEPDHPVFIVIKAALEAKDEPWEKFCDSHCVWTDHHPDCKLAQIEQPKVRTGNCLRVGVCASEGHKIQPQRTFVGLTDEERRQVYADWRFNGGNSSNLELCRAIEAKLKEKNT
jgi:hypothetical protein